MTQQEIDDAVRLITKSTYHCEGEWKTEDGTWFGEDKLNDAYCTLAYAYIESIKSAKEKTPPFTVEELAQRIVANKGEYDGIEKEDPLMAAMVSNQERLAQAVVDMIAVVKAK